MPSETLADSAISTNPKKPRRLNLLLWGPPGTGKTVIAHSLPRTRTLDLDDGLQSVEWAIKQGIIDRRLDEVVKRTLIPPEDDRKNNILDEMTKQIDEWLEEERENPSMEWDTLIIDSATALTEASIVLGLKENARLDISKSWGMVRGGLTARAMRIQDWGTAAHLFKKFIIQCKGLGKNIVLIAHEREQTDDEGTLMALEPAVIGQLRNQLPGMFGEVWYCHTAGSRKKVTRQFQTEPDRLRRCQSKLGCLDPIEEADFSAIKAKVAKFYGVDPEKLWTTKIPHHEPEDSAI
jgi:hypothetical protein